MRQVCLALAAMLVGCGASDDELHVLAASSLTDVAAELEARFEAANPDIDVVVNSAGSNALVQLVNGGAPADILLPANRDVLAQLEADHIDLGTAARNRLTIAVPSGNPASIERLDDLADEDLAIAVCAPGVPCGDATAALPVSIAADTFETNVRQVAAKVANGEVDAGVVYVSDIVALDALEEVALDPTIGASVDIPIISLSDRASDFAALLLSDEGRAVLDRYGFDTP